MTEKIEKFFSLPRDFLEGAPIMEIWGNQNFRIDGYKKILRYDRDYILISSRIMLVEIVGVNLGIIALDNQTLNIEGEITSVNLKKGGQNDN